jgi:hypothetical protein
VGESRDKEKKERKKKGNKEHHHDAQHIILCHYEVF